MKTRSVITMGIICTLILTGCGDQAASSRINTGNKVEETINQQIEASQSSQNEDEVEVIEGEAAVMEGADTQADVQTDNTSVVDNSELPAAGYSVIGDTTQTVPLMSLNQIKEASNSDDYDIDLMSMSSDLVYAAVYNILNRPAAYEGSTIRMYGDVVFTADDAQENYYANCVVADALACCAQGIEFRMGGDGDFECPQDYPAEGTQVVVSGVLESYTEGDYLYFRVGNADVALVTT